MTRRRLLVAALAALALTVGNAVFAQAYPTRPIKLVLPGAAGGPTDALGRVIAEKLAARLNQPVVVENRAGANGQIGTRFVISAPPDGYTILLAYADPISIAPHTQPELGLDAKRDLAPVALLGYNPASIVIRRDLPANDLKSFFELAKASPGKMSFASWGIGSSSHLRMEMLMQYANLKMLHVTYSNGTPAMLTALMTGEVDSMLAPLLTAVELHRAGKVKIIGISTPQRLPSIPDVSTLAEQHVPVDVKVWLGILAPIKTPTEIVTILNREITTVLQEPETRARLVGTEVGPPMTPKEFGQYLDAEFARWGKTVRDGGVKLK